MKKELLLTALAWVALTAASTGYGAIKGPYSTDANTVFLLHMDEPATAGIATNAVPGTNFIATANPNSVTPKLPTPGILGATGASGLGYSFGGCANLTYSNSVGLFVDGNQNDVADVDVSTANLGADSIPMNSFTDPTTGAFTLEALVKLPALPTANAEIVCMDPTAVNPLRSFQWRFIPGNGGSIEFNKIDSGADLTCALPPGPEAFIANQWFHVAVTYDGSGTVNFYWTRLDNTRTSATLLKTFSVGAFVETGTAVLTVGNENRNTSSEALNGYIDEVRISNIARAATDMLFDANLPPIAPSIDPQPTDQFVGVGETLTIVSHVSGSTPLVYIWQKDAGTGFTNLLDQTGDTLSLPVVFDAAGDYRYIATNSYGAATSVVAHVTVGAVFSEVYKTGFDINNAEADDAVVEAHYKLLESADPANYGPDAWVSTSTAEPIISGVFNYNDANSKWIFYQLNPNATVLGSYTYRLSFLLDSAQPADAALQGTTLASGSLTLLLNGQATGVVNPGTAANPVRNSFSFTLTNGFVAGLNTLDFVVNDAGNAYGLNQNGLRVSALRGIGTALPAGLPTVSALPSQNVREGGRVTFAPVALGRPPLSYQWYADGSVLQDATNRTLTLNPVYTGAQGSSFALVVNNDSGSVTSQVAVLTIVPTNQPVVTTPVTIHGFRGVPLTNSISRWLQQNASDPDGDPVSFSYADATGTNTASPGTITQSGAYLVYSNDPTFVGQDGFNVYLSDGQGGDATLTVQVQISELTLRISRGPTNTVRLAWPAGATTQGYSLFSATEVTGPFTTAVSTTVVTEGTESATYVPPANGALFYRLLHP